MNDRRLRKVLGKSPDSQGYSRTVVVCLLALVLALAASTGVVYLELSAQISSQQQDITQLNELVDQLNVTTYPVGPSTCTMASLSPATESYNYTYSGIQLSADLNATNITSGQTIQLTLAATNTLPRPLKAITTLPWPVYGMDSELSGLSSFPMGVGLFRGYETCGNISSSEPLTIHVAVIQSCPSGGCPYVENVVFQPSNDVATPNWSKSPSQWSAQPMRLVITLSTYFSLIAPNGTTISYPYPGPMTYPYNGLWQDGTPLKGGPMSFEPGIYTIAAGGAWGQYELLYFTVS